MNSDNNIVHPYELRIREDLDKVLPNAYDSIEKVEKLPLETGLNLLKILIEYACMSQNIVLITLAREQLKKIPLKWLTQYFLEVANGSVDFDDEWEYLRLLELVREAVPELLDGLIDRGLLSENDEVQEAAEWFRNK
ncbi:MULTISPECIES: hypothetical protein [unclassified Paenibacillus]|uniref:hypothetical protein n=1 Tax=unclassified Paenibacillus TaxID=185978 RepID=UPI00049071EC|nr:MULTISPECIES: hypothetical protein [unclassified Paenibacillus]SDF44827.1 hypothetical protein SAMN04488689_10526 [Paenibacillus sp. cl6col]